MNNTLEKNETLILENRALQLRIDSIRATTKSKSGHPTSCLSAADIISSLFFYVMKYDPTNPQNPNNDRFILSKGHAVPVVYSAWKQVGVISDEDLLTLREFDSVLEGHPTPRFKYNEAATGSLGQGLGIGAGMALNARLENLDYKTYVMLGDGEIAEGSVWEAAEFAAHYKLNNLIGIVDANRLGQSGESIHNHDVEKYAKKFEAFGWHTSIIDGHNIEEIVNALKNAQQIKDKPIMFIAKTYKGHGIKNVEDKNSFHGKPFSVEDAEKCIQELKDTFLHEQVTLEKFTPHKPKEIKNKNNQNITIDLKKDPNLKLFINENKMATRQAFGYALAAIGKQSEDAVVLDADVKNSTFTDIFQKDFPKRFFQCFIAEQNMVSVATGLQARGKIAFAATFGAFLTRAFDQIRMAGIGRNALKLCGSHSGVSIGEDGPSQMGLEDISMIRSIPNSVVLYPSDSVSAYKLVEQMTNYNDGISYMRTTRGKTIPLYNEDEKFQIGGCKILKQSDNDKACIIAAGITLHEALKAYEELKKENILVSIIDLYSVKPLDKKTIIDVANKSQKKVITVEDHYLAGGIGEAIKSELVNEDFRIESLCVEKIARSASCEKLLSYEGIDAASIVEKIKKI